VTDARLVYYLLPQMLAKVNKSDFWGECFLRGRKMFVIRIIEIRMIWPGAAVAGFRRALQQPGGHWFPA
jgi:hypothetical protein